MHRRYNLAHFLLASVVVLGLALLIVCVDVQAQIAFASDRDGNTEIYVMSINGKNQRKLTNNPGWDSSPSWSPDGKCIVFSSDRDGNREIYVMGADGKNQRKLTDNRDGNYSPSWSPDGKHIVFSSDRKICVMDADGTNQQKLTQNDQGDFSPSWSPDGKRIVFSSVRDGHFRAEFEITSEIYVMDADGGNQRKLTKNHHADYTPSWSPDSKHIIFSSERNGNFEICVMDADGNNQRRFTKHSGHDLGPAWYIPALQLLSPVRYSRCGGGSNRSTDNCRY